MIAKKISYFFCVFLIIACKQVLREGDVIYVDLKEAKTVNFSDWFLGIDIIPLETKKSSLIGRYNKLIYEHQRFYIQDSQQRAIFVFDSQGMFLFSTLIFRGQGPGEYMSLTDFCINPFTGNLEILDASNYTMRVYDKDGIFTKNITLNADLLPLGIFIPLSSDLYLFNSCDYEKTKTAIKVFSISKNEVVRRIVDLPENTRYLTGSNPITFNRLDDCVLFSFRFSNNDVFQIDSTGNIAERYQYHFGNYTFDLKSLPANQDISFYRQYDETNKRKYIFPLNKPENNKYRFCFFLFNDEIYVCRQNKESLHLEIIKDKFIDGEKILPFIYIDDNYAYNIAEPAWLDQILPNKVLTPEQQGIVSKLKEDDNPVIIRFIIK